MRNRGRHSQRQHVLRGHRDVTRLASAIAVAALAGLLSGCAPTVALEPAEGAADPACAAVTVLLPDEIDEGDTPLLQRETNAQATGAWGDPVAVVLHCGVESPAPTSTLPCVTVPGGAVDWLVDDSKDPEFVFTSYGREPAVSVVVDYGRVSGTTVLQALDRAVDELPKVGACIGIEDAQ